MSGVNVCVQHSLTPNQTHAIGGRARMADAHSTETWKSVLGWPQYEVSDLGSLRRCGSGEPVGQWLNDQGYPYARFSRPRKMIRVHRVVAEAFVPNPDNHQTINHLNNVRSDNRAVNLEWCSQRDNLAHARRQGRMLDNYWLGKRSPNARLSDEQVFEIRQLYATGNTSWADLALRFGISKHTIGRIVRRQSYV